jgi:hypothetical protein
MLQQFYQWLKSFFVKKAAEQTFSGWIKDDKDERDQIFGETK